MDRISSLRIRGLQAHPVIAPLKQPITTSSGSITEAPLLLIDLETEEGVTGRSYLFGYQAFALKPLNDLVLSLADTIKGDAVAPFDLERKLRARFTLLGGAHNLSGIAVSGIDMAAWDALACALRTPLVALLGGERKPIKAYNSLGMLQPGDAADQAAKSVEAGYRALKIKIGWPTVEEDLAVVRAARKNLPEQVALMVDFNQSLTVNEAIRRGWILDHEGVYWIEEPLRCDDFQGHARVAAELRTPMQMGENFSGPADMQEALRANASDFVMPDVQQIGGITGWLRAAALAQAAGKEVSSHIFVEHSAHLLPVTPTCHWLEYLDVAGALLNEPLEVIGGSLRAPDRPGTGLSWDEDAVKRYRLQ